MKGVKLLIIDDAPSVRRILAMHLKKMRFQVIEAEDGEDGIERCRTDHPDLVLCDLMMPKMDGLAVLATLTREFPDLPVIIVSAIDQVRDAVKALKNGAWDYLSKPIEDMDVLTHAIDQALEKAYLMRKNREYHDDLETTNQRLRDSLQQLEEDEEAGRQIQFQLLPETTKTRGCYRFSHCLLTSLYLSGDFVDYFTIDDNYLGFYMADVAGHGVSSAFVTVLLKSYMSRYLELYRQDKNQGILDPARILKRLNHNILTSHLGKSLTMFYGVINRADNRLCYSNGGQFPFPVLFDGDNAQFIEAKSRPLGMFEQVDYQNHSLDLPPRFTLALFSDGILDVLPYTKLRDKKAFLLEQINSFDQRVEQLADLLEADQASSPPDDLTFMLIQKIC